MGWSNSTRVLAIRHGETAWNVDERIQGSLDVDLNDNGRLQAARLGESLREEGIDALYSSDLSRARDTARAVAQACGLPMQLDERLRERAFGIFEGLTFKEIEQRYPDDCHRWRHRDPLFGPERGERLQDFFQRAVEAFTSLASRHPGQTIAVVTHGGVLDCLYRAATQVALQAPRTWSVANTSVNRVLYTGEGFSLIGWGDVQHLDELPLEPLAMPHPATRVLDDTPDGDTAAPVAANAKPGSR